MDADVDADKTQRKVREKFDLLLTKIVLIRIPEKSSVLSTYLDKSQDDQRLGRSLAHPNLIAFLTALFFVGKRIISNPSLQMARPFVGEWWQKYIRVVSIVSSDPRKSARYPRPSAVKSIFISKFTFHLPWIAGLSRSMSMYLTSTPPWPASRQYLRASSILLVLLTK